MSDKSNNYGRAHEYACIIELYLAICRIRPCTILKDSSFTAAENAWNKLDSDTQSSLKKSSVIEAETILELEKKITEDGNDLLTILIQPDDAGKTGDVRDILIVRRDIRWEIGLSLKHNHEAVKHSRLSGTIDFGKLWYELPCHDEYWNAVKPIFEDLEQKRKNKIKWSSIENKWEHYYTPILNAFIKEVKTAYAENTRISSKMARYLLGRFDFYKVISLDRNKLILIQAYNFDGTLNKPSKTESPQIDVPISILPERIISIELSPKNPQTTVELFMDNGWTFTLRIHSADAIVESSLKFDVSLISKPATVIEIKKTW